MKVIKHFAYQAGLRLGTPNAQSWCSMRVREGGPCGPPMSAPSSSSSDSLSASYSIPGSRSRSACGREGLCSSAP